IERRQAIEAEIVRRVADQLAHLLEVLELTRMVYDHQQLDRRFGGEFLDAPARVPPGPAPPPLPPPSPAPSERHPDTPPPRPPPAGPRPARPAADGPRLDGGGGAAAMRIYVPPPDQVRREREALERERLRREQLAREEAERQEKAPKGLDLREDLGGVGDVRS